MKKRILVTAIGTVTATAIVKELKKTGNYYIIGADVNNQNEIATSLDVDEYYKFPYAVAEDYIPFAVSFCKDHEIDYYYAVIDKEVVNLSKNRDKFDAIGTKLCIVNYSFAEICHYKNKFGLWIENNIPEIAIKSYKTLAEAEHADYPVFLKPIEGVASSGCRKINSFIELSSIIMPVQINRDFLVQEYINGQNITVDCIRNRKTGQKIQIQREELLRNSNGCGIAVKIFHDDQLTVLCDFLMERLDLNGVVNMEFFQTHDGYKIIEINPRFSAGTAFSCMAGINTVLNAINIVDGQPCQFGKIDIGACFAERYEAYKMN